jgi:prepilin-type N-terminal cleavage/methylation domain-containing protein
MSPLPDRRRDGFTLIEVLIAFVILGVASLALYRGMTTGLSGTAASEIRTTALLLARSKLDEVGASLAVEPGVQRGSAGRDFGWTVAITPFLDTAGQMTDGDLADDLLLPITVFQISVTVADRHGYPVTLTSWRLAPGP